MQLDQRLDQRQAQSRSAALLAHEAVEDVRLDMEGDAPTGVRDQDAHLAHRALGAQRHRTAGRGMADCALGQMVEELWQAIPVAPVPAGPLLAVYALGGPPPLRLALPPRHRM